MIRYVAVLFLSLFLIGACVNEKPFIDKENILQANRKSIPTNIDFNFHVRPILSDKCFKCHGPDKYKIGAGLSFASEEEAFKALKSDLTKHAIVSGDTSQSVLVERINVSDETILMPPLDSYLSLNDYEKKILIKWIDQGAQWKKNIGLLFL